MDKIEKWIFGVFVLVAIGLLGLGLARIVANDEYARGTCYRAGYSEYRYVGGPDKVVVCSNWVVPE